MSGLTPNAQNRMDKRILIDATNVNITVPGGGSFATQGYIEALLALFPDQVDVLHPAEAHIRDARYHTIDVPGRSKAQQYVGLLKGQFHRAGQFIIDYLSEHPNTYEYVFINTGLFAGSIIPKVQPMHIKTIVLHHNYEPEFRMDSYSSLTFGGRTAALVRYWERKGYKKADINLFLTQQDKERFEKEYGVRQKNYITGVFEPTRSILPLITKVPTNSAVITCALGDKQNQESLLCFAEKYLPIFEQTLPGWHVELMGRNPSKAILLMADQHSSIALTPNPEDIRSLAAQSKIYLCPMDAGGGLKLRIMDGLRAGQPVLAHVRAARGYEPFAGQAFFQTYSDEQSFLQGLQTICQYIQSAEYTRTSVQSQYYGVFGLESGIKRLESILRDENISH